MNSLTEETSKTRRRQLILFVNLNGVNAVKKDLFVKFSAERANCLNVNYSALNISMDENRQLQAFDLKNISMSSFIDEPIAGNELKRRQIYDSKMRVMADFQKKLKRVEGTYDYILVVGEMSRSSTQNAISNISRLSDLADSLKGIIDIYASKHLHLRVQVCFSHQVLMSGTSTSFASALVPYGKFVHLSAPTGWSIIGRNGAALDFNLLYDVHFDAWAPFLSYAIMNNLSMEKIKEAFDDNDLFQRKPEWLPLMNLKKARPEMIIEGLNMKLYYPSQKSEDNAFAQLEHQSLNSFRSIASTSTARSPAMSRSSSTSSMFREIQTPSPMPEVRTITPDFMG